MSKKKLKHIQECTDIASVFEAEGLHPSFSKSGMLRLPKSEVDAIFVEQKDEWFRRMIAPNVGRELKRKIVYCKNCKKPFFAYNYPGTNRQFCSQKCKSIFSHLTKLCPQCGKEFTTLKSYEKQFCSKKCSFASRPHIEKVPVFCKTCGKVIRYVYPSEANHYAFCSKDCRDAHREKKKITLICEQCTKEFRVKPHREAQKFCSPACHGKYRTAQSKLKKVGS